LSCVPITFSIISIKLVSHEVESADSMSSAFCHATFFGKVLSQTPVSDVFTLGTGNSIPLF